MTSPDGESYAFYHYNPSLAAAVVFIILFFTTTLFHSFQLFRRKTWYFIPFLIGGVFETIGYICRALSSRQSPNWTLPPYIMQSLLLLLGPTLFAASIYMVLGRIIQLTDGESCSIVKARWLTKLFVAGDVLSFLVQSSGGGLLAKAKSDSDVRMGENLITGGLAIQVLFFGCFIVVAGIFHYRIRLCPTSRSASLTIPWERHLYILYLASFLILVRSVFRIAEYAMGGDGILLNHEIFLYIFDSVPMLFVMAPFNVWHPSNIITNRRLEHLDSNETGYSLESQEFPVTRKR